MGVDSKPGLDLKWVSLITLVLQNTSIVLVMRYSRSASDDLYIASTAVVMGEFVKLFASLVIYIYEEIKEKKTMSLRKIYMDVFGSQSDWLKMTVPAILYFIQNNLQYNAITLVSIHKPLINIFGLCDSWTVMEAYFDTTTCLDGRCHVLCLVSNQNPDYCIFCCDDAEQENLFY
jgi:hypothetical protein